MNLPQLLRALGGEITGRQVLAPGPNHSKGDRSLAVRPSSQSPDGFVVHSFAGDDWRDCVAYVRQRLGLEASPYRHERRERSRQAPPTRPTNGLARELFAETIDPRGTAGERYLAVERGLSNIIDATLALTIRFHPACPFRDDGSLIRAPAIVCAVRSLRAVLGAAQTLGELEAVEKAILRDPALVTAVQRIRLTPDGRKVERRSLGAMGDDGVVLCGSLWEPFYSGAATIAEGVETALAMRKLGFVGAMALAGVGRFKTFEPPFHVISITVSGENDATASENGWRDAGPRWAKAGHEVTVWTPPDGIKDANDFVCAQSKGDRK